MNFVFFLFLTKTQQKHNKNTQQKHKTCTRSVPTVQSICTMSVLGDPSRKLPQEDGVHRAKDLAKCILNFVAMSGILLRYVLMFLFVSAFCRKTNDKMYLKKCKKKQKSAYACLQTKYSDWLRTYRPGDLQKVKDAIVSYAKKQLSHYLFSKLKLENVLPYKSVLETIRFTVYMIL